MTTFAERHAPKNLNDLVFADKATRQRIDDYANGTCDGHILLHGPFGTGKSTVARMIAEQRLQAFPSARPEMLHASHITKAKMATIRNQLGNGWNTMIGVGRAMTLIDEIDQVAKPEQHSLRSVLDGCINDQSYIFTTNELHNVDGGLANRCDVIELPSIDPVHWRSRADQILKVEGVVLAPGDLKKLLALSGSSIRDLMRLLEEQVIEARRNAA